MRLCVILQLLLFASITASATAPTNVPVDLVFAGNSPKNNHYGRLLVDVLNEISQRIGRNLKYRSCSPLNCAKLSKQGVVDGEIARAALYQELSPHSIRVNESLFTMQTVLLSKDPDLTISSWEQLKSSDLSIGYKYGIFAIKEKLDDGFDESRIHGLLRWNSAVKKLREGLIDVYLSVFYGDIYRRLNSSTETLHVSGEFGEVAMYIYLSSGNESLKESFARAIKTMKNDGTMDALIEKAYGDNVGIGH